MILENFEAVITFDHELSPEETSRIEQQSADLIGGAGRGYVEFTKIAQTERDYSVRLRLK